MKIQGIERQEETLFLKIHDSDNRYMHYVISNPNYEFVEGYSRDLLNNEIVIPSNELEIEKVIEKQLKKTEPPKGKIMQEFFIVDEVHSISEGVYSELYVHLQEKFLNKEEVFDDIQLFKEDLQLRIHFDFVTQDMFDEIFEREMKKIKLMLEDGIYL